MKKFSSLIIFIICVSNVYAQDSTTITDAEKKTKAARTTGLVLISGGVLLQITGILIGIESNRYYIETYDSHAEHKRTNSIEDAEKFNSLTEQYTEFLIASASVVGAGFITTIIGSVLLVKTRNASSGNDTGVQPVSFANSFSRVPIVSNSVYFFNYGHQLGIRIQ